MDIAEYHKMYALEKHYWWFQGRRKIILTMLDQALSERMGKDNGDGGGSGFGRRAPLRLLDVGCGTGMLLEDLGERGTAVGLDFSPLALEYCRSRDLRNIGQADVRHLPVRNASIDVITALDLIEHVRDDVGLLHEMHRALRPGGVAVMSVPAHKKLWSGHDIALHHFRRYEKNEFLRIVTQAGLQPLKYSYGMATAYLPAAVYRRAKQLFFDRSAPPKTDEIPIPKPVNATLLAALKLEARLLKAANLPFGLSLLCVAQKPL